MFSSPNKLIVDFAKLESNYNYFKSKVAKGVELSAVVKADAYGFGAVEVTKKLIKLGVTKFFVAHLYEAINLHNEIQNDSITYYVFHGFINETELSLFSNYNNITPVINSLDQLNLEIPKSQNPIVVHVDTGMNRLGMSLADFESVRKDYNIEFVISHLSCAKLGADNDNLKAQAEELKKIKALGHKVSFANSYGAEMGEEFCGDIARLGGGLYGTINNDNLKQIGDLKSEVIQVRRMETDCHIGYNASYAVKEGDYIATIPMGYADGYPRLASNKGYVLIKGKRCEIAGIISMDLITVKCDGEVKVGDEVILSSDDKLNLIELAKWGDTIRYDITAGLGDRVERTYKN